MKQSNNGMPFWKNPRLRHGSIAVTLLCFFLALLLALNMLLTALETKHGWRVDYSFNALTTQSETTLDVLADLKHPVHIYALFSKGQEDGPLLELLNRYSAASPLVTWEQEDVNLNPGLLTKFSSDGSGNAVTNDTLVVWCEATNRWRVLSPMDFIGWNVDYENGTYQVAGLKYESELTSAIAYVTQETVPQVKILQDHGELDATLTAPLIELLERNHYEVSFISLLDAATELQPQDLLMILSPTRDLMGAELEKIVAFTEAGGSVFFTCDYSDPVVNMPNYRALMRVYGFEPLEGIVVASAEEPDTYYQNFRIDLIPYMQETEATHDLVHANRDTLLLTGTRAFAVPTEQDNYLDVGVVLASGYKAYLHDYNALSLEQSDDDPLGPFALALQAQRFTEAGSISRAFVLGCSTVLTSSQLHAMTDSQEFIIRMVEFLTNNEPVGLNIMAKTAVRPQLSVESVGLGSVILVCLPLCIVVAALLVLVPRRRR